MLGYEMKLKDKVLYLPLEVVYIISRRSNNEKEDIKINVGTYDLSDNVKNWVNEELNLGDVIEITVKQIEQLSAPESSYNYLEYLNTIKEDTNNKILEDYFSLKRELEIEGLI